MGWAPYRAQYAESTYDVPVPDALEVDFEKAPALVVENPSAARTRDGFTLQLSRPVADTETVTLAFLSEAKMCDAPWTVRLPTGASSFEPRLLPLVGDPLPAGEGTIAVSMLRDDDSGRFHDVYFEELSFECADPTPEWLVGTFESDDFHLMVTKCGRFMMLNKRVTGTVSVETMCGAVDGEGAERVLQLERWQAVHPGLTAKVEEDEEGWRVRAMGPNTIEVTRDGKTVTA